MLAIEVPLNTGWETPEGIQYDGEEIIWKTQVPIACESHAINGA